MHANCCKFPGQGSVLRRFSVKAEGLTAIGFIVVHAPSEGEKTGSQKGIVSLIEWSPTEQSHGSQNQYFLLAWWLQQCRCDFGELPCGRGYHGDGCSCVKDEVHLCLPSPRIYFDDGLPELIIIEPGGSQSEPVSQVTAWGTSVSLQLCWGLLLVCFVFF